ncbi:MAG: hypothetical protein VX642_16405 [Bdellovibrionota bacterium]|nr:hypothetical protein [Bdellovibrionota bacterium]
MRVLFFTFLFLFFQQSANADNCKLSAASTQLSPKQLELVTKAQQDGYDIRVIDFYLTGRLRSLIILGENHEQVLSKSIEATKLINSFKLIGVEDASTTSKQLPYMNFLLENSTAIYEQHLPNTSEKKVSLTEKLENGPLRASLEAGLKYPKNVLNDFSEEVVKKAVTHLNENVKSFEEAIEWLMSEVQKQFEITSPYREKQMALASLQFFENHQRSQTFAIVIGKSHAGPVAKQFTELIESNKDPDTKLVTVIE